MLQITVHNTKQMIYTFSLFQIRAYPFTQIFSIHHKQINYFKHISNVFHSYRLRTNFGHFQSICQCIANHSKFPGKMSLYTVATYSQHSVASNIFASRAVFAVLRPISVALSRHNFGQFVTQLLAR